MDIEKRPTPSTPAPTDYDYYYHYRYSCPICGEKFASLSQRYSHFKMAHPAQPIAITWETRGSKE